MAKDALSAQAVDKSADAVACGGQRTVPGSGHGGLTSIPVLAEEPPSRCVPSCISGDSQTLSRCDSLCRSRVNSSCLGCRDCMARVVLFPMPVTLCKAARTSAISLTSALSWSLLLPKDHLLPLALFRYFCKRRPLPRWKLEPSQTCRQNLVFEDPFRFVIGASSVHQNPESEEHNVKVNFTGKRLASSVSHGRKYSPSKSIEHSLQRRRGQSSSIEVA